VFRFYRVSTNTLCIELYANKVVDGEIKKVVVMRNTWGRASWLAAQVIAQMFAEVATLPLPDTSNAEEGVHIH
jgi:hypothetical protein